MVKHKGYQSAGWLAALALVPALTYALEEQGVIDVQGEYASIAAGPCQMTLTLGPDEFALVTQVCNPINKSRPPVEDWFRGSWTSTGREVQVLHGNAVDVFEYVDNIDTHAPGIGQRRPGLKLKEPIGRSSRFKAIGHTLARQLGPDLTKSALPKAVTPPKPATTP